MTIPVEGLDPLKEISWTMWNLDADGQIESWLGTRSHVSANELLDSVNGVWTTISADSSVLDTVWARYTIHGIEQYEDSRRMFIFYSPNAQDSFVF